MPRPTITQVAALAGVSIASASRALNDQIASAETIEKVRKAAAELGYIPDSRARSLKLGRTQQLAYAVADIGNPVYVEMMSAVQHVVAASGYRLVISSTGTTSTSLEVVDELRRGHVDGLILSPLRVTDELIQALELAPVPVVVLGRAPEESTIDSVRADSPRGMRMVVDHLVATGRRRLVFLNGPRDTTPGRLREEGFLAAMAAHPDAEGRTFAAPDFTIASGYAAAQKVLDDADDAPLDAIVAANDLIGIGALHAADDLGWSVPGDLSITGMDNTELAEVTRPGLTSVDLGAAERGRLAAELLLARIAEPTRAVHTVTVAPSLTIRASSMAKPLAQATAERGVG
ncbi:LacI family DNA-binding transcriptional regulator [Microbacterium invictum]|uniref:LacI family DNA-binding transcriptional regulator n=1 Tax=Microbacterium invictum TaxID=515415 RepID=A0ABZ0V889_9MICO|nr:LacI family DNA-binding transcriptional regulator [Microbacterium invictum]WQB69833.1 LacI family DNA-binding transcriptional regulator [Microbacterium invictum]